MFSELPNPDVCFLAQGLCRHGNSIMISLFCDYFVSSALPEFGTAKRTITKLFETLKRFFSAETLTYRENCWSMYL
jgi:hypothetical protein